MICIALAGYKIHVWIIWHVSYDCIVTAHRLLNSVLSSDLHALQWSPCVTLSDVHALRVSAAMREQIVDAAVRSCMCVCVCVLLQETQYPGVVSQLDWLFSRLRESGDRRATNELSRVFILEDMFQELCALVSGFRLVCGRHSHVQISSMWAIKCYHQVYAHTIMYM